MEGSNKDAGSHGGGTRRHRKPFGNWLRNRLGGRQPIPVALSLFAVRFYNHFLKESYRLIQYVAALSFRIHGIKFLAGLTLICMAEQIHAVTICENNLNYARYGIESSRADWDLYGYNSVGLPFPQRAYGSFNEGDNIEWIYYALENQYAFLDDTLYRITGGCYLLGPVCYPHWHGFRYYYYARYPDREIICTSGNTADTAPVYVNNIESGDLTALSAMQSGIGRGNSLAVLRKIPRRIYPGSVHDMDTEAVPELSTFTLFGLAALQILRLKKSAGN